MFNFDGDFSIDDAYKLFELNGRSSLGELEAAFKKLARKYHPDKQGGSKEAERFFAHIVDSYERLKIVLGNGGGVKSWRELCFAQSACGQNAFPATAGSESESSPGEFPAQGNIRIWINFREAVCGTRKRITIKSGTRRAKRKKLIIKIPPLTRNGTVLRLKKAGFAPVPGAPPSDVLVEVLIWNDYAYAVKKRDLFLELEISPRRVRGGGRIKIPSPYGALWAVLPPESKPGTTIRLRGRGLKPENPGEKAGDLYVKLVRRRPLRQRAADLALRAGWIRKRNPLSDKDPFIRIPDVVRATP